MSDLCEGVAGTGCHVKKRRVADLGEVMSGTQAVIGVVVEEIADLCEDKAGTQTAMQGRERKLAV